MLFRNPSLYYGRVGFSSDFNCVLHLLTSLKIGIIVLN